MSMSRVAPSWCAPSRNSLTPELRELLEFAAEEGQGNVDDYVLPVMFDHVYENMIQQAGAFNRLPWDRKVYLTGWDSDFPRRSKYRHAYMLMSEFWNGWRDAPWDYGFKIPYSELPLHITPASLGTLGVKVPEGCSIDVSLDVELELRLYDLHGHQHITGNNYSDESDYVPI